MLIASNIAGDGANHDERVVMPGCVDMAAIDFSIDYSLEVGPTLPMGSDGASARATGDASGLL